MARPEARARRRRSRSTGDYQRPAAAGDAAGDAAVQLARRAAGARRRLQLAGQVDGLPASAPTTSRRRSGSPMKRPRTNAGPLLPIRQGK